MKDEEGRAASPERGEVPPRGVGVSVQYPVHHVLPAGLHAEDGPARLGGGSAARLSARRGGFDPGRRADDTETVPGAGCPGVGREPRSQIRDDDQRLAVR